MHAAPARSVHRRGTSHQPDLRLRPAGQCDPAEAGLEEALEVVQHYALDLAAARFGTVDDGTMVFGRPGLERPSA